MRVAILAGSQRETSAMRAGSAADAAGVRAKSASRVMAARERMADLAPLHALGSWGNFCSGTDAEAP